MLATNPTRYQVSIYNERTKQKDVRYISFAKDVEEYSKILWKEIKHCAHCIVLVEVKK